MKRLLALVSLSLSILALSGCDNDDLLQWSPDGKTFTVVKDNTLKLGTPDGKLSAPIVERVELARWLPDSKRALAVTSRPTASWTELAKLLSPTEQSEIKKMANKVWLNRTVSENQPYQMAALLYLKHTYGNNAFYIRFKKMIADFKGIPLTEDIDEIKLVDVSDPTAAKRQLLWQTAESIEELRISPDGKTVAVSLKDDSASMIVVLPLSGNHVVTTAAINANSPDWSLDGRSIYYVARQKIDDTQSYSDVIAKTPEPYQETVESVEVIDTAGRLLPIAKAPKTIATVLADGTHHLRCLPDGSILFDAKQKAYPSSYNGKAKSLLFRVKPETKSVETIAGAEALPDGSLNTFEPNRDGTFISGYGSDGDVAVLELNSGKVTKLEPANKRVLSFSPQWRTNDELCFLSKQDSTAGGHDFDLVIQSVKDFSKRSVLTKDWSTNDYPFLKKPEEKKAPEKTRSKTK